MYSLLFSLIIYDIKNAIKLLFDSYNKIMSKNISR